MSLLYEELRLIEPCGQPFRRHCVVPHAVGWADAPAEARVEAPWTRARCVGLPRLGPGVAEMLNAIRLNVYKADAVLYAGDLTGKAMVPIVAVGGDRYEATLLGQRPVARTDKELAALERDVAASATTPSGRPGRSGRAGGDKAKLDALFEPEIRSRVEAGWTWRPSGSTAAGSRSSSSPATTTRTTSTSPWRPASTARTPMARSWTSPVTCRSSGWGNPARHHGGPRARFPRTRSARRSTRSPTRPEIQNGRSS